MPEVKKVYLGDAVFARYDGFSVWLTTENGIEATNTICIDPEVAQALIDYIELIREANKRG